MRKCGWRVAGANYDPATCHLPLATLNFWRTTHDYFKNCTFLALLCFLLAFLSVALIASAQSGVIFLPVVAKSDSTLASDRYPTPDNA